MHTIYIREEALREREITCLTKRSVVSRENMTRSILGIGIGENSVIAAGSYVTKSIPPNVLALGSPCRVVKSIIPTPHRHELNEADKIGWVRDIHALFYAAGKITGVRPDIPEEHKYNVINAIRLAWLQWAVKMRYI